MGLAALAFSGSGIARAEYLERPEAFQADGPYIHGASGMTFPTAVGDFKRGRLFRYDTAGLDVSAGYNWLGPAGPIVATVYVYPAGPSAAEGGAPPAAARARWCADEFAARQHEIVAVHPDAKLIQERDILLARGDAPFPGKAASYRFEAMFAGRRRPVRSELDIFCHVAGRWAFEYRFTFPDSPAAADLIETFMRDLPWTIATKP